MTPSKPIEPGCLVMVLPGGSGVKEYDWSVVTALSVYELGPVKRWRCDIGVYTSHLAVPEKYLLRIDDPGLEKEIRAELEKEHGPS